MGHFKNLKAWQHARRLALLSRAAINRLPPGDHDELAAQWRRASYSVVLNIAEVPAAEDVVNSADIWTWLARLLTR